VNIRVKGSGVKVRNSGQSPIILVLPLELFLGSDQASIGVEEWYKQLVLLKAGSYPNEGSILLLLVT
jgi:hypothetical protein